MSEDTTNAKVLAAEPENLGQEPRARGKEKSQVSQYVAKVYKKAAQIADLMTEKDVAADLRVLRAAKRATHHVFDTKLKKLVKVPDHKTRLAAVTLSRAYHEGRPVEKSISLHADAKDFPGMVQLLQSSPAFLEDELSEQKTVEDKEITENPTTPQV